MHRRLLEYHTIFKFQTPKGIDQLRDQSVDGKHKIWIIGLTQLAKDTVRPLWRR